MSGKTTLHFALLTFSNVVAAIRVQICAPLHQPARRAQLTIMTAVDSSSDRSPLLALMRRACRWPGESPILSAFMAQPRGAAENSGERLD